MAIDLANVDISLKEFDRVASGKYNAGEVKLTGTHKLGKINNHVVLTSKNNVSLSQEEVLAIKEAFINALERGGLDAERLNEIRGELGLAPKMETDTTLIARSLKPLSRQQIREILDRNADVLNVDGKQIRTSDEIYACFDTIPALRLMDGILASCDYGVTKPDARLFEALYARFGLRPQECFFIDDMPRNIAGAAATGMIGHCFADKDLEKLKDAMRAHGVRI